MSWREAHPPSILRARSWKIIEYLHPNKKTTHIKEQAENGKMENRKINAETNSHGNKLSTQTNAFHQLFHQRQQPCTVSKQQECEPCNYERRQSQDKQQRCS